MKNLKMGDEGNISTLLKNHVIYDLTVSLIETEGQIQDCGLSNSVAHQ